MIKNYALTNKTKDSYLELVLNFPLASIKTEAHFTQAQKVIDGLIVQNMLDDGEELYLDALTDLIATYEDVHYPIKPASDADMLRHFMEAKGVTQAQLSKDTALPKSSISEVLAGKKPLSRQMIRKLASYFKVNVSVLAANV